MNKYLQILILLLISNYAIAQNFIAINQNYKEALQVAQKENKMIFIDFYTTWCAPCKKLDKLVFKNDSIKKVLGKNFILLKYNAENDSVFNLSKKYHVSSYPTGIILNKKGFLINRIYGFPGNDFKSLSKSVKSFTEKGLELNKEDKTVRGYSNTIDVTKYPKFYIDYVNRTNTKIKTKELSIYLKNNENIFSEEYFATLNYFGRRNIPDIVANKLLDNKEKYQNKFGEKDVNTTLFFISSGMFDRAIKSKSQEKFNHAVTYIKKALSEDSAKSIVSYYTKRFKEEIK